MCSHHQQQQQHISLLGKRSTLIVKCKQVLQVLLSFYWIEHFFLFLSPPSCIAHKYSKAIRQLSIKITFCSIKYSIEFYWSSAKNALHACCWRASNKIWTTCCCCCWRWRCHYFCIKFSTELLPVSVCLPANWLLLFCDLQTMSSSEWCFGCENQIEYPKPM